MKNIKQYSSCFNGLVIGKNETFAQSGCVVTTFLNLCDSASPASDAVEVLNNYVDTDGNLKARTGAWTIAGRTFTTRRLTKADLDNGLWHIRLTRGHSVGLNLTDEGYSVADPGSSLGTQAITRVAFDTRYHDVAYCEKIEFVGDGAGDFTVPDLCKDLDVLKALLIELVSTDEEFKVILSTALRIDERPPSEWADDSVNAVVEAGIMSAERPRAFMTREEFSVAMCKGGFVDGWE